MVQEEDQETETGGWASYFDSLFFQPPFILLQILILLSVMSMCSILFSNGMSSDDSRQQAIAHAKIYRDAFGSPQGPAPVCTRIDAWFSWSWQCVVMLHPEQPPLVLRCDEMTCQLWR